VQALIPLLLAAGAAAADVTIEAWNGMLLVRAPASAAWEQLPQMTQRISLDARDMAIADVAAFLRQATALNIVVAPGLLAAGKPVTLQVREMRLANVLRWLERTASLHIGWVDGALYLADQPVAGAQVTRLYDARELQFSVPDFPGPELALDSQGAQAVNAPAATQKPQMDLDALIAFLNRTVKSN
jgi:hypothetical protein